jgi:hypothetical protein
VIRGEGPETAVYPLTDTDARKGKSRIVVEADLLS